MKQIWVVDDDRSIRWVLEKALARAQMPYRMFESALDVVEALKSDTPSVLLSDIRMHDMTGVQLLAHIKNAAPDVPVVIMTAYSDLDSAVTAFQGGAYEYLAKPFDINKAIELLRRACEESERAHPADGAGPAAQAMPEIVGHSHAMQEVFRAIGRLSQSHVTVLLTGESGTGKEVVARALHRHSLRSKAPFVAINTAAIPRELLESELFGHERGAFTGANQTQYGRFEQAKGGTLFLDEIGDMPMDLQTRLLRVLSDGCYYRVGGRELLKADVRVIAATNQDLEQRVRDGLFREDLYHRLNVIHLRLPALRERPEDIEALTEHFLTLAANNLKTERKRLTPEALEVIRACPFPGNVRQLENLCNWLTVMAPAQMIHVDDLPYEFRQIAPAGNVSREAARVAAAGEKNAPMLDWRQLLQQEVRRRLEDDAGSLMQTLSDEFESTVYRTALEFTHGRKIEAALKLGVGRNTLTRKIQELGIWSR
ncbi:MAG: nitrogen regulation protein NR(I) [Duodenibacillus sp.]|nr:nitrogen regulation protein NR(I) [Duodenibacillus sp.]